MHAAWFGEMIQTLVFLTDRFKELSAVPHSNELAKNMLVHNQGNMWFCEINLTFNKFFAAEMVALWLLIMISNDVRMCNQKNT